MAVVLVIPLRPTRNIQDIRSRSIEDLLKRRERRETPSIYLEVPRWRLTPFRVERYEYPVDVKVASLPANRYRAYYGQLRQAEEVVRGWEYSNGIYLEFVPE